MAPFKPRLVRPVRSKLNSRLRCYGLTAKEIIEINEIESQIIALTAMKLSLEASPLENVFLPEIAGIYRELNELLQRLYILKAAPHQLRVRTRLIVRKYLQIDNLIDEDSRVMINFRFMNKAQLRQLHDAFQFPAKLTYKPSGNTFSGEEVFLAGLFRIHGPVTQLDNFYYSTMGLTQEQVSMCISCFLDHVVGEWGYLITNHLDFFKQYWKSMCIAAQRKLRVLRNLNVAGPGELDGYVFPMFIDNSIVCCTRAGGGPQYERERDAATLNQPYRRHRRNDPLLQRAIYTGFKKAHGLKVQTINVLNGMIAHCSEPTSTREPDTTMLRTTMINQMLRRIQINDEVQYFAYGDSAYDPLNNSHIYGFESKAMNCLRQSIEHDYSQWKQTFAGITHSAQLKIRLNRVGHLILATLIMHNAYLCLNAGLTATRFKCDTPSLLEWMQYGPRGKPRSYFQNRSER